MTRRIGIAGLVIVTSVLVGCVSTSGGIVPLRDQVRADKAAFEACADKAATRLIAESDYDPQTIATTALARCDNHWHDYTAGLQQLYTRQTRNITYGHLQSRSEGFDLNNRIHRRIKQRAEKARAAAPDA